MLSAEETDSAITVVAPNAFISKWVRDRYLSTIDSLATAYFPQPRTIRLTVAANAGNGQSGAADRNLSPVVASAPAVRAPAR